MRKRAQSAILQTTDLDFCVLSYTCSDPTISKLAGVNTKVTEWKVQCRGATPLDIVVIVDKQVTGRTEVGIKCNGNKIFPSGPSSTQSRMVENFEQVWPFRGVARGIGEPHFVEVRLHHFGNDEWFPATVLKQRTDGFFEVLASRPGTGGYYTEELYPFVNKQDLREASSKMPYTAPERYLTLRVKKDDPLHNTELTVDGGGDITRYFGRPTPPPKSHMQPPMLTVSRDRMQVTGNIGHRELMAYWLGEAKAVDTDSKRPGKLIGYGSKKWRMMVGLWEHTIEIERKHKTSKDITLKVDGEILIEALAEDIGSHDGWQCGFRFCGEPRLDFDVYETDVNGNPLDSKGVVPMMRPYNRLCFIDLQDYSDMTKANLFVDGVSYNELPLHRDAHMQGSISISPTALASQYQITTPYKVNREARSTFGMNTLFGGGGGVNGMGLFGGQADPGYSTGGVYGSGYNPGDPRLQNQPTGAMGFFQWCCGAPMTNVESYDGYNYNEWQNGGRNQAYMNQTVDGAGGTFQNPSQAYSPYQNSSYNNPNMQYNPNAQPY